MKVLIVVLLLVSSVVPAVRLIPAASHAPAGSSQAGKLTLAPGAPSEDAVRNAMAGKNWLRKEVDDNADGHKIFFSIFALDFAPWRPKLSLPRITVVCSKKPVSARIFPAGPLKDGNVKITFDNGTVLQQKWKLVDGAGVPSPADESALFKGLATAKSLKFENNPSDTATTIFAFNMGDYHESVLKEPLCKQ